MYSQTIQSYEDNDPNINVFEGFCADKDCSCHFNQNDAIIKSQKMKKADFIFLVIMSVFATGSLVFIASHQEADFGRISHTKPVPQVIINTQGDCLAQDLAKLDNLWQHIYHPARLQVESKCEVVTGTVFSIIHEPDGDIHMRLTVDPQYQSWINPINVAGQRGKLVIEPICNPDGNTPITQADAVQPCGSFTYPLVIPKVGSRIKVVGSKVLDVQHHGWAELHPVLSFTKL